MNTRQMNTRQQDVDQSVWWVLTLPVRRRDWPRTAPRQRRPSGRIDRRAGAHGAPDRRGGRRI